MNWTCTAMNLMLPEAKLVNVGFTLVGGMGNANFQVPAATNPYVVGKTYSAAFVAE